MTDAEEQELQLYKARLEAGETLTGEAAHRYVMLMEMKAEAIRLKEAKSLAELNDLTPKARVEAMNRELFQWYGSHERLTPMLDMIEEQPSSVFWPVFLYTWPACDFTWHEQERLFDLLSWHSATKRGHTAGHRYLQPKDRRALRQLPDVITVYRGCDVDTQDGISWTLSREVAIGFAIGKRSNTPEPRLVTATVSKRNVYALLSGTEQEVLCLPDTVINVENVSPRR